MVCLPLVEIYAHIMKLRDEHLTLPDIKIKIRISLLILFRDRKGYSFLFDKVWHRSVETNLLLWTSYSLSF